MKSFRFSSGIINDTGEPFNRELLRKMSISITSTTASLSVPFAVIMSNSKVIQMSFRDDGSMKVPKEILVPFPVSVDEIKHFIDLLTPPCRREISQVHKNVVVALADYFEIEWLRMILPEASTLLERLRVVKKEKLELLCMKKVFLDIAGHLECVHSEKGSKTVIKLGGYDPNQSWHMRQFPIHNSDLQLLEKDEYKLLKEECYNTLGIFPANVKSGDDEMYRGTRNPYILFTLTLPGEVLLDDHSDTCTCVFHV
jgi:hypothetical protein